MFENQPSPALQAAMETEFAQRLGYPAPDQEE